MIDAFKVRVRRKPPELLRTAEAAEHCGISESTFEKLRCYGGGPTYIKIGRRVVYELRELDRWIDSHKRSSTKDAP